MAIWLPPGQYQGNGFVLPLQLHDSGYAQGPVARGQGPRATLPTLEVSEDPVFYF